MPVAGRVGSSSLLEPENLRSPRDFRRVLDEGKRFRKGGVVLVRAAGRPGPPRLGLVVSRHSGNAVTRNRVKRRLRHAVRALSLEPGMDYVIIANSRVGSVPYARLVGWLRDAIEEVEGA